MFLHFFTPYDKNHNILKQRPILVIKTFCLDIVSVSIKFHLYISILPSIILAVKEAVACLTRTHYSRIRTPRFSGRLYWGKGVYLWVQGVSTSGSRGCLPLGPGDVYLWVQGVSTSGSRGCLPLGPGGVYLWVQGVSTSGSRGCLPLGPGGVSPSESRGCLPLGPGGVYLWVQGMSTSESRGCLPLGPGGVCLWVQGVSTSECKGCLPLSARDVGLWGREICNTSYNTHPSWHTNHPVNRMIDRQV